MAIRKNPDGSITVGIINEPKPIEKPTEEKPKPKRVKTNKGEG